MIIKLLENNNDSLLMKVKNYKFILNNLKMYTKIGI